MIPLSPQSGRAEIPITPVTPTGRANWHWRVGFVPAVYLAALVVLSFAHTFIATWYWLAVHLLMLGAATNAILVWSAHFTSAVLRVPALPHRRGESIRLIALNAGVVLVLVGGTTDWPWTGVVGAAVVFTAVAWHLCWLAARLRAALPARFAVTAHYYVAACCALLTGIPVGAWMLVTDDGARDRLILFHAHVNVLGWVALTIVGTLFTLWPTVLRTRLDDGAPAAARTALPTAVTGVVLLGIGVLAWWPVLAAAGIGVFGVAVVVTVVPGFRTAWRKPPQSFAAWSIAAGVGWLLVALGVDAVAVLSASDAHEAVGGFGDVLTPLLVGAVAQILLGALAYLMPVVLGGGPGAVRERGELFDRHWAQRVAMGNAALVVFVLPAVPYVRIAVSTLLVVALLQFLLPAARVLLKRR
ncbi:MULTISPECIES: hypothetical protein [Actinosynnema]|uniref:hypothetical protein n=1 Tax=Actinosynnema TaxID=40566 RepID=UPI0020A2BF76|nr:hypothetical protein [Actinosynnema pretiosum]MCP2096615.1 hypothetical protein [Actinosynnema pretiosum]